MDNLELITLVTFIFFIYLLIALLIERALEVLMALFNYAELKWGWYQFWNRQARRYQKTLHHYYKASSAHGSAVGRLFVTILSRVITETPTPGGRPIVSAELIRLNFVRVGTRLLALILALVLVFWQNLDFLELVYQSFERAFPGQKIIEFILASRGVRLFLTAAAISVGSEPLHQIISSFERFTTKKTTTMAGGGK